MSLVPSPFSPHIVMHFPTGTLFNVATIIVGSGLGLLLHGRLQDRYRTIVFQGLGLCTLALGVQMSLAMQNPLHIIFAVLLGGILGEWLRLEQRCEAGALKLKEALKSNNSKFVDGMVTASVIYAVGPMAILGSFDEGLRGDHSILSTKAVLDGFASVALASTYGLGVLFSFVPVAIYQLSLTFFASSLQGVFDEATMAGLTATGGVLILGISIKLLELKHVPLTNLLPALPIVIVLMRLFP